MAQMLIAPQGLSGPAHPAPPATTAAPDARPATALVWTGAGMVCLQALILHAFTLDAVPLAAGAGGGLLLHALARRHRTAARRLVVAVTVLLGAELLVLLALVAFLWWALAHVTAAGW